MTICRSHLMSGLVLATSIGLGLAMSMPAQSQGMGPGMMGGGMMGGHGARNEAPSEGAASNLGWSKLNSYVQSNGLACTSCHGFSGRGTGPAFIDIAHRFAGQANAESELAGAISIGVSGQWPGYPPMPGGLANPKQARSLAALILDLSRQEDRR